MNEILRNINARYEIIQDHVHPTTERLSQFTEEERIEFRQQHQSYVDEYQELMTQVFETLETLQPSEITLAYKQGCRLLQMNLSGYMGRNFSSEYIDVMESAIKSQHFHTGWLFLQALADNIGSDVEEILAVALQFEPFQATALSIVRQLELHNFLAQAKGLKHSNNENVKFMAQSVIAALDS